MNIYSIITLIAALISGFLSIYAFRYRKTKGALSFSGLSMAAALYALGYVFEVSGTTIEEFRFGLYIEYLGIPFIPLFWVLFSIQFVGKQKWVNWKLITPLLALSLITLILNFTNQYHHLYYRDIQVDNAGPFPVSLLIKGNWYWVYIIYINIATLFGNILLIEKLFKTSPVYRRQIFIMVIGSLCPWIGHIIYQTGLSPYGIDISPIAFSITGIIYTWGIFHFRILDLFPIALENVFESMEDAVIMVDNKKRIVNINTSAKYVLEKYNKNIIGNNIDKDFDTLSVYIDKLFYENQKNTILVLENYTKYYDINISPIIDKRNKQLGNVIIFNDITDQKQTEKALRDSERQLKELNATKDKFFNIIAHDLINPFNSLIGLSNILVNSVENKQSNEIKRISNLINASATKGYKLLENLLEWARMQTGRISFQPEKVNISNLTKNVIRNMENQAANKKITIGSEIINNSFVFADENMIKTIVRNLLANAIKFTLRGGQISIILIEDNSDIVVSVNDNGIGISKNHLAKLFKLDHIHSTEGTENETGTGLGLLLCKEFIDINKGKLWVKSELGKGSEFSFSIPKCI